MQFLVIGYDGKDEEAPARRQGAREGHLESARAMKKAGHFIEGGAILDEEGGMIGSMLIMDFPSRKDLDAWLQADPYVKGNVWKEITVQPFRCAPL